MRGVLGETGVLVKQVLVGRVRPVRQSIVQLEHVTTSLCGERTAEELRQYGFCLRQAGGI